MIYYVKYKSSLFHRATSLKCKAVLVLCYLLWKPLQTELDALPAR